jgi:hypothetical protein
MDAYRFESHSFIGWIASYRYCSGCGLIYSHNQFTQWCVDKGCNYRDHPSYKSVMHKFTNPWRKK